jgi:riboflavin kinase
MPPLSSPSPTSISISNSSKSGNENDTDQFYKLPDFYSTTLNLLILGYIRPEYDYVSRDALVEDIRLDCEVARKSLQRDAYVRYLAEDDDDDEKEGEERRWLRKF